MSPGGDAVMAGVGKNGSGHTPAELLALAEQAEAEAEEAEALAAAARARARAIRLRQQAKDEEATAAEERQTGPDDKEPESPSDQIDVQIDVQIDKDKDDDADVELEALDLAATKPVQLRRWLRRPGRAAIGTFLAVVLILGMLVGSGYIYWEHRADSQQRARSAEFAAAARQGVVTMLSLDFNKADADVKRIIDNSTGQLRDDFAARADDFTTTVRESKVVTHGTVNATAVDLGSMTDDSAVVLVAANSNVTNSAGAEQEPRVWKLAVTVARDSGQLKLAKVEFIP